jgi:uncharacterized protein (TIGR03435 family)
MLSLLKERFGLKYHTEDQPQTAYNLVAAKPKMKQADPASRTNCKSASGQTGQLAGTTVITCHNINMEEFANYLGTMGGGLSGPVFDASGLEGRWDLALSFTRTLQIARPAGGGGDAGQPGSELPAASDPTGGYTIFEAIERQLGLKLETVKKPLPAIVIDHIDEKPRD